MEIQSVNFQWYRCQSSHNSSRPETAVYSQEDKSVRGEIHSPEDSSGQPSGREYRKSPLVLDMWWCWPCAQP